MGELSQQWKESTVVSIYRKGNENGCSNHQRISFLSTSYKIVPNIPTPM